MIGCCSWPIRARLRVTGPSDSAVGVWSLVWQFCALSANWLVSGGRWHCTSTILHVGGNRWASSLLFKLLGRFSLSMASLIIPVFRLSLLAIVFVFFVYSFFLPVGGFGQPVLRI